MPLKKRASFTILELLVVVSIMGLIMALAIPSVTGMFHGNAVNSGTSQVANMINLARATAVTSRSHTRIIFAENPYTNSVVSALTSYAILKMTNQPATNPANWIYINRWENLPRGAFFPSNSLSTLASLPNNPFTNNVTTGFTFKGIEFKSTGAPTATVTGLEIRQGTVINGTVLSTNNAANKMTVDVDGLMGKVKINR